MWHKQQHAHIASILYKRHNLIYNFKSSLQATLSYAVLRTVNILPPAQISTGQRMGACAAASIIITGGILFGGMLPLT